MREGREGLEHVEALLRLRGVPLPRVPRKFAQRSDTSQIALAALRDSPKTGQDVCRYAASVTDLTYEEARSRMYQALQGLRRRGLVEREGRLWKLAPHGASP